MPDSVSKIFHDRPEQWGLRGDPFLWDDLERHFDSYLIPLDESVFAKEINRFLSQQIEGLPERFGSVFIEKYAHGGMSSGCISLEFWHSKAIPLLIERLNARNGTLVND